MIRHILDRLTGRSAERAAEAWARMHNRHGRLSAAAHAVIRAADDPNALEAAIDNLTRAMEDER